MKLVSRLLSLLRRSPLACRKAGVTCLYFNPHHDQVIRDYYLYVVDLIARAAGEVQLDADIVFGSYPHRGRGKRRTFRVDFQIEHTLVKPGGRGAESARPGSIPVPGMPGQNYLVRVQDENRLAQADAIVEYSAPNLANVRRSGLYPELSAKLHYIAPLVYPIVNHTMTGRDLEVITLFGNPEEPRRNALLQRLTSWNDGCQNIRGHFSDIQTIYRRTRILVNVRQTDHHDTLEELRVLPALLSGVIVISEDVPLREEVPYRDFILWAPLSGIPALVQTVHENYDEYFSRFVAAPGLAKCLREVAACNERSAGALLNALAPSLHFT